MECQVTLSLRFGFPGRRAPGLGGVGNAPKKLLEGPIALGALGGRFGLPHCRKPLPAASAHRSVEWKQHKDHSRPDDREVGEQRERAVAQAGALLPSPFKVGEGDGVGRPDGPLHRPRLPPVPEEEGQSAIGIHGGQFGDRAIGEGVGTGRGLGPSCEPPIERVEGRNTAQDEHQIGGEGLVPPPLAGGVRRIALVEPPRRQLAHVFVQREVGELVTEDLERIARRDARRASLHHDAPGGREGNRGAPLRRPGADQLAELVGVPRDLDPDVVAGTRKSRKGVASLRRGDERSGEGGIARVRQYREPTALDGDSGGDVLRKNRGCREEGEKEGESAAPEDAAVRRYFTRGGSPPASTIANTSAQRFPHGLNLFAA